MLPIEPGLGAIAQGREYCRRRAWAQAYEALSLADRMTPLGVDDLELLAQAAYLAGRDADYLDALARAHHACLAASDGARAARSAFWLGFRLALRGEAGRANGWLARARRALDGSGRRSVEEGYLLLPVAEQQLASGAVTAALATATRATEIGERFADPDLIAAARHQQGRIQLREGQIAEGLALLDEAMVAVVAGELSPLVTGLVYCSAIEGCQEVFALARAREWTSSLAQWCDEQPEMIAFSGICRVHRAEILLLGGSWQAALDEARRARERASGVDRWAEAAACYQQGEVHRLRGELEAAETAFRSASELGLEPQPGMALLRLGQGRTDAAVAAIRRVVRTAAEGLQRTRVLPACIEILLAAGDAEEARRACGELEQAAKRLDADILRAMSAQAIGAIELAAGNAQGALASLRRAHRIWLELEVPYEAARVRVLVGLACRALGDCEGSDLELDAATAVLQKLGAAQLPASRAATADRPSPPRHPLTARELQVLRLVAAGKTNRAIGIELFLSEKTIDRHVSNIFAKLEVSSRTAATAYAFQHQLI
jgi:ATP/maltotriose-dependent transcriptional regulator MalT